MKNTTSAQDPALIKSLFSNISANYDRANDVMTFGLARLWRRQLVRWSGVRPGMSVLDCATGTGDLALEFKRYLGTHSRVVGTDFCEEMLHQAPFKAAARGLEVEFQVADAMALPFIDQTFDTVSIAYGIRNVADPVKALREMARVCKPGGVIMVLETGDGQLPFLKPAMRLYFEHVVPRIGAWITGHRSAYEYLNKSSSQFPARNEFIKLAERATTFTRIEYRSLMAGASFLYRLQL